MQYIVKATATEDDTAWFDRLVEFAASRVAMDADVAGRDVKRGTDANRRAVLHARFDLGAARPSIRDVRLLAKTLRAGLQQKEHPGRDVEVILLDD